MNAFGEYRIQSILGALQALLTIIATFYLWIDSKLLSFGTFAPLDGFALLVYRSGFLMLLVPIAWVITTIRMEKDHVINWHAFHTLVSGIILVGLIIIFYAEVRHSMNEGRLYMHIYVDSE